MRVVLVHGFNVRDPMLSVGKLAAVFEQEGVHAHLFRYGWLGLLGVRTFNDNLAEAFRCFCEGMAEPGEPVVVIAHSNGATLAHRTAWLVDERADDPAPFTHMVYLSPALDRDAPLAPQVKQCDVFHTKHDWAVRASSLLIGHPWGSMGAMGAYAEGTRYRNVDGTKAANGHSAWFQPSGLAFLRERLVRPLIAQYGRT